MKEKKNTRKKHQLNKSLGWWWCWMGRLIKENHLELILPCFAHLTCSHQYRKEKDKTKYSFLDQHKNKQTKNPPSSNISFSLILSYGLKIKIQDIQSICYNSESEGFYFWMEWVLFLQKHLFLSWDLLAMWIFYASLVRASAKMILFRRKGKQLLANFCRDLLFMVQWKISLFMAGVGRLN